MGETFYEPLGGGRYRATRLTQGPWDAGHQHGGPAAALLAGAMELDHPRPDLTLTRFAMEILGPIPVGDVTVSSTVVRDGRRVQYVTAEMAAGGRTVALARGWRLRTGDTADAATPLAQPPEPLPERSAEHPAGTGPFGYFDALDWRFARGEFNVPGPVVAWLRLRVPVLPGVTPTPMQRLVAAVDSASGVSNEVSFVTHLFSNVDLTVHVARPMEGEWLCVDGASRIGPGGAGLCRTQLYDEKGDLGTSSQALFIQRRPDA